MVGRPGRSKGCLTCKRRKKGCDLVRPSCGQCVKAKIECGGYDASFAVVAYQPPSSSAVVEKLHRSAIEIKYIDSFWDLYLPSIGKDGSASVRDWTRIVQEQYTTNPGLRCALLALALARIGERQDDSSLIQSGSKYYGTTLQEVTLALGSEENRRSNEVLATCLLLGSYEIFGNNYSPGLNWQNHAQGIGKLIQTRKPQEFASGDGHALFLGTRLTVICSAIVSRKATFLSSSEWLLLPWSNTPKTSQDSVIDLAAQIPSLLEMFDHVNLSSHQGLDKWETFLSACWRLDGELKDWRQSYPHSHQLDSPLSLQPGDITDAVSAVTRCTYWMTCIFLYTLLRLVWQSTDGPHYILPPRTDPLQYVDVVSRSAPYFLSPIAGEVSTLPFAVCIGTALQYLGAIGNIISPLAERITESFMDQSHGRKMTRINHFLVDVQSDPARLKINPGVPMDVPTYTRAQMTAQKWWGGGKKPLVLRPSAASTPKIK